MSIQHFVPPEYSARLGRQPSRVRDTRVVNFDRLLLDRSEPGRFQVLVEAAIVPQLALVANADDGRFPDQCRTAEEIELVMRLALRGGPDEAAIHVETAHRIGLPVERVYLELLAPAAHRLVSLEANDSICSADLTISLWHLQLALRRLAPAFQGVVPAQPTGRRALILLAPGERHGFRLAMLGEFLLRAGWSVTGGPGLPIADSAVMVRDQWFDLVAFTAEAWLSQPALQNAATTLRGKSRNGGTCVVALGPTMTGTFEGIDAVAADARHAVMMADRLVDRADMDDRADMTERTDGATRSDA